jgi:hypothetical protein
MRTSENSVNAKFAEFAFHALGGIEQQRRAAQEKPTNNSGKEKELLRKLETHPTNAVASADESAMNFSGSQNKKNVGK